MLHTWKDLGNIMLLERIQTRQVPHSIIPFNEIYRRGKERPDWWLPGAGGKDSGKRVLLHILFALALIKILEFSSYGCTDQETM